MDLTGTGIWSSGLRYGDRIEALDAAAELESLGYTALWIPGGAGGDIFESCATVLDVTKHITVATGIVNLWMHTPDEVCSAHGQMQRNHAGRFLLGVGISHAPLIDANEPGRYRNPLATTAAYLDALDDGEPPVPVDQRVLAALGPKMLELARDRTRGAHPYLVTPEHTLRAREILGDGALLGARTARRAHDGPGAGARAGAYEPRDLPRAAQLHEQLVAPRVRRVRPTRRRQRPAGRRDGRVGRRRRRSRAACRSTATPAPTTSASRCSSPPGQRGLPLAEWRELAPALTGG